MSPPISDVLPLVEQLDQLVDEVIHSPDAVPSEVERLATELTHPESLSAEQLLKEYAFFLMLTDHPSDSQVLKRTRTYLLNNYPPTT